MKRETETVRKNILFDCLFIGAALFLLVADIKAAWFPKPVTEVTDITRNEGAPDVA